jgi:hypothetical protein
LTALERKGLDVRLHQDALEDDRVETMVEGPMMPMCHTLDFRIDVNEWGTSVVVRTLSVGGIHVLVEDSRNARRTVRSDKIVVHWCSNSFPIQEKLALQAVVLDVEGRNDGHGAGKQLVTLDCHSDEKADSHHDFGSVAVVEVEDLEGTILGLRIFFDEESDVNVAMDELRRVCEKIVLILPLLCSCWRVLGCGLDLLYHMPLLALL